MQCEIEDIFTIYKVNVVSGTPVRISDSGKDLMLVSSYICKELNGTYVYSCCYDLINTLLKLEYFTLRVL